MSNDAQQAPTWMSDETQKQADWMAAKMAAKAQFTQLTNDGQDKGSAVSGALASAQQVLEQSASREENFEPELDRLRATLSSS